MSSLFRCLCQELIDEIVDRVTDRESLQSCALTCHAFLPRAQARLFRVLQFKLKYWAKDETCRTREVQRLHEILTKNPSLRKHPRQLRLCSGNSDIKWMTTNQHFFEVIGWLENVDKVEMQGRVDRWAGVRDLQTYQAFLDHVWKPLIQPRLRTLNHIGTLEAPLELVTNCPRLTTLAVGGSNFFLPGHADDIGAPLSLTTFSCKWLPKDLPSLFFQEDKIGNRFLDLSNLSSLKFSFGKPSQADEGHKFLNNHLLPEVCNSLKSLELLDVFPIFEPFFDIASTRLLNSLQFEIKPPWLYDHSKPHLDHMARIAATLDALPQGGSLRRLGVGLCRYSNTCLIDSNNIHWIKRLDWATLEAAIMRWQQTVCDSIEVEIDFGDLQRLGGDALSDSAMLEYLADMENFKENNFPELCRNPFVKFKHSYDLGDRGTLAV
ncbi:hypothetical protein CPB83DRAFT_851361 [Crepidotus variabilis]|uniref:Uncharacterized protein n=1 Tax=Crepidotus variabilis TaxID=179855 RepID=A0A9P6EII2_9AGAR|nr:hypothetical protein CPB83DRAFT_851361 [Crepidotus variabilis]